MECMDRLGDDGIAGTSALSESTYKQVTAYNMGLISPLEVIGDEDFE